jgi:ferredoxin
MGCGICTAECPACAIQLNNFESRQFKAMLDELFKVQGVENVKPVGVPQ